MRSSDGSSDVCSSDLTDLGEYIIQLAHEPPSHIIGPALHKTREQVAERFEDHHPDYAPHGVKLGARSSDPQALVSEARSVLRDRYFQAEVGITGANFLIAETGATVIVTNEGNGDLTDRKRTRLNSSLYCEQRMPSSDSKNKLTPPEQAPH